MIKKILTDNGLEFTLDKYMRWGKKIVKVYAFDEVCIACGIEHRLTRPYTPKTNGLVERTNDLIQEGTYKKHRYPGYSELIAGLHQWMVTYNTRRLNRQIGRKTPCQATCDWYDRHSNLFIKEPTHILNFCSQRGET